jgi:hypothetical protein
MTSKAGSGHAGLTRRDQWALKMQERYALDVYKEYWGVSSCDITEVDQLRADGVGLAKMLDADGGTDKIIQPNGIPVFVAQRFRKNSKYPVDFSIRARTYSQAETEIHKLLRSKESNGNLPGVYAFGVGDSLNKQDCLETGFKEMHFLDVEKVLKLLDSGEVESERHPNGDGSAGMYIEISDLHEKGAVFDSIQGETLRSAWNNGPTDSDFPTAPHVRRGVVQ